MPKKLTFEKVKELFDEKGYILLEKEYINNSKKMKYICSKHSNNIQSISYANLKSGRGCYYCGLERTISSRKLSFDYVKQYIENSGYILLSEKYINSHTKLKIQCNKGHIYESNFNNFKSGARCNLCAHEYVGKNNSHTDEDFKKILKEKTNGLCIALEKYKNNRHKILFKNISCGHIFKSSPNHVLEGHTCPICGRKKIGTKLTKTQEQYEKEVFDLVGEEYTILGTYLRDKEKIKFKHNKCGRIFNIRAGNFLQGVRCPFCSQSKGEKKITDLLYKYNIKFKTEYRIKNCKYKYTLPFDFAIFNDKHDLKLLIEYDGELHFKSGRWHNAKEKLSAIKRTEEIKNNYCKDNNIKLIRIPYWEFNNIEKILKSAL